jgi:biopolymer transport protein ExbD
MALRRRSAPEVNAGSMADIAFLLLIFFIMSTTMDTDTGLARMLPPPIPPNSEAPPPIKDRNVFVILLNSKNQLLVEGQYMEISQLREAAKEFVENPLQKESLSEAKLTDVKGLGLVPVSKGVISLQNDRGTQYQAYLNVQNELQAAYDELRNEFARRNFSRAYKDLQEDLRDAVKEVYPQRISEAEPKNVAKKTP